jgi:tetratricopeptide (TPR) repeat protein
VLDSYQQILDRPKSEYTAEANLVLGIFNRQKDRLEEAVKYFKQLELTAENADQTLQARSNVMRISQKSKDYSTAEQYARKLIEADKANEDLRQEARMIIAKYLFDNGKESEAMEEFNRLRKVNSEIGAESRYYIAQIHHNRGDFKKCEKAVYDLVDEMPSYDYWLAKSFILLADNYVKLGNVFQAKRTLQSVIDNHEGEELKNIAIRRLEAINLQEGNQNQDQQQPDQQNELRMNDSQDDQLFDQQKDENQEGGKDE